MKVVLRDDVENLGNKGDIVDVRDGYARNYLVPRGLAISANRGVVKQAEAMRHNRDVRDAKAREVAHTIAKQIAGGALTVKARAGEGGKLFGSVGTAEVAAALHEQFGVEVDRKAIRGIGDAIKELGTYEMSVRLHPDVVPALTVNVVGQ